MTINKRLIAVAASMSLLVGGVAAPVASAQSSLPALSSLPSGSSLPVGSSTFEDPDTSAGEFGEEAKRAVAEVVAKDGARKDSRLARIAAETADRWAQKQNDGTAEYNQSVPRMCEGCQGHWEAIQPKPPVTEDAIIFFVPEGAATEEAFLTRIAQGGDPGRQALEYAVSTRKVDGGYIVVHVVSSRKVNQ